MSILPLRGRVRSYGWGSRTALAAWQGRPVPTPEPEAELWFGAHPLAPAEVLEGTDPVLLPEWIARDPVRCLGESAARRFDGRLPFLLKVLAVEQPLSLQVHPDAARARAGFERETRESIPLGAARRCYPDPNAKPELVWALEPFVVLHGFRPLPEIRRRLEAVGLERRLPRFAAFRERPDRERWRAVFGDLLALGDGRDVVQDAARALAGSRDAADAWLLRLARRYPADPAVLAPLFCNLVTLRPGQALFLPPGRIHCYLEGLAVEVMASSDNVLRAGLTEKHVDREELMDATDFEPREALPCEAEPVSLTEARLACGSEEFELAALLVTPGRSHASGPVERAEMLLCVEGEPEVADPGAEGAITLGPGQAVFVSASGRGYRITGEGRLGRVRIPGPPRG